MELKLAKVKIAYEESVYNTVPTATTYSNK